MSPPEPGASFKTPGGKSLGTVAFVAALVVAVVGVVSAAAGAWRVGVGYVGGAMLLACLARFVLPDRMAGLLRVRRKAIDVLLLAILGFGVVVLAIVVPEA